MTWTVEFFDDDQGRQPAREWLQSLDSGKRAAAIAAIETYLSDMGQDICGTEHGKHLGQGLFEFRIRHDERVIRRKAGEERGGKFTEVLLLAAREQRKTVTVLFCDVTGSTSLGESVDPEALRTLLARYFEQMKGIVESHGGRVEKFIGDAVMAVFGVPIVHGSQIERAGSCGSRNTGTLQ